MTDWPTWAAAVWCEAYLGGSHKHVMGLKFLRAPDSANAKNGAVKMLLAEYPHGSDFEAIVSLVPQVDQSAKRRDPQGLDPKDAGNGPEGMRQTLPSKDTKDTPPHD